MSTGTPQFTSYEMSDASSYAMSDAYQYNPYMMQHQANPYAQCNSTQPTMAPAQNFLISLDDYSDYSSDDEPQQPLTKPTLTAPTVEAVMEPVTPTKLAPVEEPVVPTKLALDEESAGAVTPNSSTCEPESDVCSLELDAPDNGEDCVQDGSLPEVPVFSILNLLQMRHAVPWHEGEEEGLIAEEVKLSSPRNEEKPQLAPSAGTAQHSRRDRPAESARDRRERRDRAEARRAPQGEQNKSSEKDSTGSWRTQQVEQTKTSEKRAALPVSDSSWAAQQMAHRHSTKSVDAEESISTEEVVRRMKSILNKLTIEKFEPLYEKLVSCGIQTPALLEALIHEVFEKATTQHHFVNMYADLCARLHSHFSENPITDDPALTFKKILLNGCQEFFEKHLKPPSNLDELDEEERMVLNLKYKTQMLGNIKFVGALLVRQMLATKVLFAICEELLGEPTPESLESLAALLTVVGPKFDIAGWVAHPMLKEIFNRVKVLTETPHINCRVRCLLKDLLELRACRWEDRKPKKIEGPSTLKEQADKQAAEDKASGTSCKGSGKGKAPVSSGKSWSSGKTWPGQGQGAKVQKVCERPISCLASDLFTRSTPSPKSASPKEGYERINSLAALMKGGAKAPPSVDRKETGSESPRKQPTGSRKQPSEEPFDKEACRKVVSGALAELRYTHEVQEALLRISALSVPSSKQSEELCDMLVHMAEEGSEAARKASFELVAALFTQGHWKPYALGRGLQDFVEEVCPDLKCDIPMLPQILREELCPALAPLVDSGALQRSQHNALAVC